MTEAKKKALALVNEVRAEKGMCNLDASRIGQLMDLGGVSALIRAIEAHDAFRQEVSKHMEEAEKHMAGTVATARTNRVREIIARFIIPKPVDPLTECFVEAFKGSRVGELDGYWTIEAKLRAALADRGLKIVQEN